MKILFVCLGNICRSPMAEFVFKDLVNKQGLADQFYISSAATSGDTEYFKETMHYETKKILIENNIPFTKHYAKQLKKDDYNKYDYIIGMEQANIVNILRIVGQDKYKKVYKLLDFTDNSRDIIDPWYYGNFNTTYTDIKNGCISLLDYILNDKKHFN